MKNALLSLLILASAYAVAAPDRTLKTFNFKELGFKLLVPDAWTEVREFMGTPVVLLSPYENKTRAVVQITPRLQKATKDGEENKTELEEKYKKIKTEYLKSQNAELISFGSYEKTSWDGVKDVYSMGVTYKNDGVKITEKTYYVVCKDDALIHIHTTIQDSLVKKYGKQVDEVVKSFQCGGKI